MFFHIFCDRDVVRSISYSCFTLLIILRRANKNVYRSISIFFLTLFIGLGASGPYVTFLSNFTAISYSVKSFVTIRTYSLLFQMKNARFFLRYINRIVMFTVVYRVHYIFAVQDANVACVLYTLVAFRVVNTKTLLLLSNDLKINGTIWRFIYLLRTPGIADAISDTTKKKKAVN